MSNFNPVQCKTKWDKIQQYEMLKVDQTLIQYKTPHPHMEDMVLMI